MNSLVDTRIISIIVTIAIIAILIYRQLRPRKLSTKTLIIFPIIVLFFIIKSLPTFHPTSTKLLEILISSAASIILGFLACRQLHVYKGPTGKAMAKGTWTYFLWWLAAFIIKSALSVAFGETSFQTVNEIEILLPVFFLISSRNLYIYMRTKQLGLELH